MSVLFFGRQGFCGVYGDFDCYSELRQARQQERLGFESYKSARKGDGVYNILEARCLYTVFIQFCINPRTIHFALCYNNKVVKLFYIVYGDARDYLVKMALLLKETHIGGMKK